MNRIITVYELLGLIKDGKAPKKIKEYKENTRNDIYILNENDWYTTEDGCSDLNIFFKDRLNDKVEIIEEDKAIEKLGKIYDGFSDSYYDTCLIKIAQKVDEVIDAVNKLKVDD